MFDSKNREAVMKEEALRSVSLDHSLSFSVRVKLSSGVHYHLVCYRATESAERADTPEREHADQMRRCVGKERFREKRSANHHFGGK